MNSIIAWVGGKRLLRKEIAKHVPQDINGYIEPFGGAAWVLLYKERWANLEVYNDLDNRLVNLFLQAKYHPHALIRELELLPASRHLFAKMLHQEGITEIQRAARFMWLITRSFGSKGTTFGTSKRTGKSSLQNRLERVMQLHKRLDKVVIESLDYAKLIDTYDCQDNFFYLDPPYTAGYTYDNSKGFDHQALRDKLAKVKGRWLLSYDDSPLVRELYKGYSLLSLTRTKGINRVHGPSDYAEVLVANYPLKSA